MPPTCSDCRDADATQADGWCDECAAMRDDDPNAPAYAPRRPSEAIRDIRARVWPPEAVRWPAPGPVEPPRYRFPF